MAAPLQHVDPEHPAPRTLARAADVVGQGGLVVYPTDTSYGIGCDWASSRALERLNRLKARDPKTHATFLCRDLSQASTYAYLDDVAFRLVKRLTPGPYTFVLRAARVVPKKLITRQKTVGLRIPDSAVVMGILEVLGRPMLNTTASRPDGEVIADPRDIRAELGHGVDLILDAGLNLFEVSTVVDLSGPEPRVVREGKGPVEDL